MPPLTCPACASPDHLTGSDVDGVRVVTCGACGHRWRRDLTPTCGRCGSTDLEVVPTATLEEAGRGSMRTPSGIRDVHVCWTCGARDATSSRPQPPEPGWRERRSRPTSVRAGAGQRADGPTAGAATEVRSAFGTFRPGAVVGGRWRLEELVRRSSTGTLWHAVATDPPREVLFKLVHPRTPDAAEHAASARAVTRVRHPHLLTVADVQRRGDDVLVVAEWVDAPTLAERTVAVDRLPELGAAVAGALAALHDHAVLHLGVEPDAILRPPDGRSRLVDLGARRVRTLRGRPAAAEDRLDWLAPEQVVARRHTAAADVYALGMTLWAAAGGRLDQLGRTPADRAQRRLGDETLPPVGDGAVPDGLHAAIAAATRRDPAERPTARELAELLS